MMCTLFPRWDADQPENNDLYLLKGSASTHHFGCYDVAVILNYINSDLTHPLLRDSV